MPMYSISFLNCLSRLFSEAYAMEPAANVTIVSPKASIYCTYYTYCQDIHLFLNRVTFHLKAECFMKGRPLRVWFGIVPSPSLLIGGG